MMKLKLTPKLALVFLFTLGMLLGLGFQVYRLGHATLMTGYLKPYTTLSASAGEYLKMENNP